MRVRLSVKRNNLPATNIIWNVPDTASPQAYTVARLLEDVDRIIPLEADQWGLEDYVVELGGFECLHFSPVLQTLREDDVVSIRPILTAEIRSRTICGRNQISEDGRHLVDGIPFGRPYLRQPCRPALSIPPRKRQRSEGDDTEEGMDNEAPGLITSSGETPLPAHAHRSKRSKKEVQFTQAEVEDSDDSEDDEDFVPGHVSEGSIDSDINSDNSSTSSEASAPQIEARTHNRSPNPNSDSESSSSSETETSSEEPSSDSESDSESDLESDSDTESQAATESDSDSSDSSSASDSGDSSERESVNSPPELLPSRPAAPPVPARTVRPPWSGTQATRKRNARRKTQKKLERLKEEGVLGLNASHADLKRYYVRQSANDDDDVGDATGDALQDESSTLRPLGFHGARLFERHIHPQALRRKQTLLGQIDGLEQRKQALLTQIDQVQPNSRMELTEPLDATVGLANEAPEMSASESAELERRKQALLAQIDGVQTNIRMELTEPLDATVGLANEAPEMSASESAELERRKQALLAQIDGVQPNSGTELTESLDATVGLANEAPEVGTSPSAIPSPTPASSASDMTASAKRLRPDVSAIGRILQRQAVNVERKPKKAPVVEESPEPEGASDPDFWKSHIRLSAFECWDEEHELSAPPFPFKQHWDAASGLMRDKQHKGKKNKGIAKTNEEVAIHDKVDEEEEYTPVLDYDDSPETMKAASDPSDVNESHMMQEVELTAKTDLPALPEDIGGLPALQPSDIQVGAVVVFKMWTIDPATVTPQISGYKTATVEKEGDSGNGAGTFRLKLAECDVPKKLEEKTDANGNPIKSAVSVFRMDDSEDEEDESIWEGMFSELVEAKLLRAAN